VTDAAGLIDEICEHGNRDFSDLKKRSRFGNVSDHKRSPPPLYAGKAVYGFVATLRWRRAEKEGKVPLVGVVIGARMHAFTEVTRSDGHSPDEAGSPTGCIEGLWSMRS
jgi:hypothetical protein